MKLVIENKVAIFDLSRGRERCFVDRFDMGFMSLTCCNYNWGNFRYGCNTCNFGRSYVTCRYDTSDIRLCSDYKSVMSY